jgi:hypothetical protein
VPGVAAALRPPRSLIHCVNRPTYQQAVEIARSMAR